MEMNNAVERIALYMEIQELWEDGNGNKQPAGLKVDFGAELEEETHKELIEKMTVKLEKMLELMGLQNNCKMISKQEYIAKYGDHWPWK